MSFADEIRDINKPKPKGEIEPQRYKDLAEELMRDAKKDLTVRAKNNRFSYRKGGFLHRQKVVETCISYAFNDQCEFPTYNYWCEEKCYRALLRDNDDLSKLFDEIKKICIKDEINVEIDEYHVIRFWIEM